MLLLAGDDRSLAEVQDSGGKMCEHASVHRTVWK